MQPQGLLTMPLCVFLCMHIYLYVCMYVWPCRVNMCMCLYNPCISCWCMHTSNVYVCVCCSMTVSPQAWTQRSRGEGWAFMKEFCNFQNCGLSFTLFNKLVWALIMENGCREREREHAERKTFGSFWIHFPFLKICFFFLLFFFFCSLGIFVLSFLC